MIHILDEALLLFMAVQFQYVLLKKRFSCKKTLEILITGVSVVFAANLFLMVRNYNLYKSFYAFTVNLPVFLLFLYVSKHRGFRTLFNLLTTVFLCVMTFICGGFLAVGFHNSLIAVSVGRLLSFPLIFLLVSKVFRPLYLMMLDHLKKGWALFCLIPVLTYSLLNRLDYTNLEVYNHPALFIPIVVTVVLTVVVYAVICVFFSQMQEQFALEKEQQLLKVQVMALQNQADAVLEMKEKTSIMYHDTRHYIQNIAALMKSGQTDTAIGFIGHLENNLEEVAIPQYCENPTINAILTYYLENAKNEGVEVTTRLDIPEHTPVDEMELSTVLANAIENARQACDRMPEGAKKTLEITCVSAPRFVVEIANTYCGQVQFDRSGLPFSAEYTHGIGTQSIYAFVKKHNALLDYQTENGFFRLRILLP